MKPKPLRSLAYPQTLLELFIGAAPAPSLVVDLRLQVPGSLPRELANLGLDRPFAVISAHNPAGAPDRGTGAEDGPANASRTAKLLAALSEMGHPEPVRADGCSPDRTHREVGFAVPLAEEVALSLAREFDQDAIFWWDGGTFWIVGAGEASLGRVRLPE